MSYLIHLFNDRSGIECHNLVAGEDIPAKKVCHISESDGLMRMADARYESKMPAICMTLQPIYEGLSGPVMIIGSVGDESWNLTKGPVYVDESPGGIRSTPPPTAGSQVQIVGKCYATRFILFGIPYITAEVKSS
jgi:hypothetical protein